LTYADIEESTTDIGSAYRPHSGEMNQGSLSLIPDSRAGSTMVDPIIAQFS
jgi:hypothetical protein